MKRIFTKEFSFIVVYMQLESDAQCRMNKALKAEGSQRSNSTWGLRYDGLYH